MSDPGFRDFAAAIMASDIPKAGTVLEFVLGLTPTAAHGAAMHFADQMKSQGPPFMMMAMGMRKAVTEGTDLQVRQLLIECFGLTGDLISTASLTIRSHYPPPAHLLN